MIIPYGNLPAAILMERIIRDNTDWLPERAAVFARQAHEGQTRKFTGIPYYTHVERVIALVRERTNSPELIAVSYLHDTMKDFGGTYETLAQHFGHAVANIVHALTNDDARKKQQGTEQHHQQDEQQGTPSGENAEPPGGGRCTSASTRP